MAIIIVVKVIAIENTNNNNSNSNNSNDNNFSSHNPESGASSSQTLALETLPCPVRKQFVQSSSPKRGSALAVDGPICNLAGLRLGCC